MENSSLLIFYIISFVILVCIYIGMLVTVLKFDRCMIFAFLSTLLVSLSGASVIGYAYYSDKDTTTSNFIGSKDYYDNYYTKGIYAQGREKYEMVGGQKDYELYKQYLKEQAEQPKMYEYPNYEVYPDTVYKTDIRNRESKRELKTTKHERHREMDNLLESAFNTQANDYFDFYYNTY